MKFLPILLLFLLSPSQSHAEYKMVTVFGAPELKTSYPWKVTTDLKWEECLDYCMTTLEEMYCHMVYLKGERCSFYLVGDYLKIRNDSSEPTMDYELVAFRVDIPNGECLGSASSTLFSQTGGLGTLTGPQLGIGISSFGISVTPESYDVTYNYDNGCSRPYRLEIPCETCSYRMYSFRGTISMENGNSNQPPMAWTQCVNRCLQNNRCILAATNTYFKCVLFEIETFDKFNLNYNYEIDPATPTYMAIKLINTKPSICSGEERLLFENTINVASLNDDQAKSMSMSLYPNRNNEVVVTWWNF